MLQSEKPIAVFDSGVGGISVLRQLIRIMPDENYFLVHEILLIFRVTLPMPLTAAVPRSRCGN